MPENKYDRLPQAGDTENESGTEVFYLAPRPVPTGVAAFSSRSLHRDANGVHLDFGLSSATLEFAVRWYIGSLMSVVVIFQLIGLGLSIDDHFRFGKPLFELYLTLVLPNHFFWMFIGVLFLLYGYSFFPAIYRHSTIPPTRFNRQRREVAYVAKRGEPPRFIPWEDVIACVSSSMVATEYGTQQKFALMIGLRDASDGQVVWLTVPSYTLGMAVGEWEAIRAYMEEGPSALPLPMMGENMEEGTVEFFHMCRKGYRYDHWYIRYLFGFLLIQFCSGWTLPCRIAAWVERLPKKAFPKAVLDWSKPLPPEQWQHPSDELIEQSKAVRKTLRKGLTVFDHFSMQPKPDGTARPVTELENS
ncbi:hypothetical protein [Pseudomonas viridiflava]|uniref:hypothetical protein n=1 Tax=Pseudomonas viridiflava TaxID=33069 RepID=UPI001F134D8E|nr:hypothetical protein [Pseudomonas viridiflava]